MELTLTSKHELLGSGYFIGIDNENISEQLIINIEPEELLDKWAYIEFQVNDNNKYNTPRIDIVDRQIIYDLPNGLLEKGYVKVQVIFRDETNFLWKSFEKKFHVSDAINACQNLPEEYPDFITEAQKLLDEIKNSNGGTGEADLTNYYTIPVIDEKLNNKQDILTAGSNITIVDNVISATSSGGSATIPIVEVSGSNITLEPNKHYVISGVTNSLTISLSEDITTELKHYSFEFSSIDRIPKVTINGVVQPYNYEYAKDTKYLCEIINNHLVILGTYDGYEYQFIYGMFASSDYTSSYTFKNDRTFKEIISGTTKNGTYKIEVSNEQYAGILTYEDSSVKMFTYNNGTITLDGVVYTKIS